MALVRDGFQQFGQLECPVDIIAECGGILSDKINLGQGLLDRDIFDFLENGVDAA